MVRRPFCHLAAPPCFVPACEPTLLDGGKARQEAPRPRRGEGVGWWFVGGRGENGFLAGDGNRKPLCPELGKLLLLPLSYACPDSVLSRRSPALASAGTSINTYGVQNCAGLGANNNSQTCTNNSWRPCSIPCESGMTASGLVIFLANRGLGARRRHSRPKAMRQPIRPGWSTAECRRHPSQGKTQEPQNTTARCVLCIR